MKTSAEIVDVFRKKYDELKTVCSDIGPFDASAIYQNPDGGWQMTFIGQGAITICDWLINQCILVPFFTYGPIFRRWIEEGGAWNEHGVKGRFGYPTSDIDSETSHQFFQRGEIRVVPSGETEVNPWSPNPSILQSILCPIFDTLTFREPAPIGPPRWYPGKWGERKKF